MSTPPPTHAGRKSLVLWACIMAAGAGLFHLSTPTRAGSYDDLLDRAALGGVASVQLVRGDTHGMARATYTDERGAERTTEQVALVRMVKELDERSVAIVAPGKPLDLGPTVISLAPVVVVGALFAAMIRQLKKGAKPATDYMIAPLEHREPKVPHDPAPAETDALAPLHAAMRALKHGEAPAHFVLGGPSGSGKTHAVMQLASAYDLHVVSLQSQDLLMMFVGVAAGRLDNAWSQARDRKPCVFLLENIDLFATKRELVDHDKNHSETQSALFKLCALLEAPRGPGPLFVGTTTRPDALDEMLVAPHRMDALLRLPPREAMP